MPSSKTAQEFRHENDHKVLSTIGKIWSPTTAKGMTEDWDYHYRRNNDLRMFRTLMEKCTGDEPSVVSPTQPEFPVDEFMMLPDGSIMMTKEAKATLSAGWKILKEGRERKLQTIEVLIEKYLSKHHASECQDMDEIDVKGTKSHCLCAYYHQKLMNTTDFDKIFAELQSRTDQSEDSRISELRDQVIALEKSNLELQIRLEASQNKFSQSQQSNTILWEQSRKMHGLWQDARGNVRVLARLRSSQDLAWYQVDGNIGLTIQGRPQVAASRGESRFRKHEYLLDYILRPESINLEVFEQIEPVIYDFFTGKNTCILAYGQTGAGKSWTMSREEDGVIPCAMRTLLSLAADAPQLLQRDYRITIDCSAVEIYKEKPFDLLAKNEPGDRKHLDDIDHATFRRINTFEDAHQLFAETTKNRRTSQTSQNTDSSRSHLIYRVKLSNKDGDISTPHYLDLVDLAGSERAQDNTDLLEEGSAIKKGLLQLKQAILAMRRGEKIASRSSKVCHVQRESKVPC